MRRFRSHCEVAISVYWTSCSVVSTSQEVSFRSTIPPMRRVLRNEYFGPMVIVARSKSGSYMLATGAWIDQGWCLPCCDVRQLRSLKRILSGLRRPDSRPTLWMIHNKQNEQVTCGKPHLHFSSAHPAPNAVLVHPYWQTNIPRSQLTSLRPRRCTN